MSKNEHDNVDVDLAKATDSASVEDVEIATIVADPNVLCRDVNDDVVAEYAEILADSDDDGEIFQFVEVFAERGQSTFVLVDGLHRLRAHERLGRTHIKALVIEGTPAMARLRAAGANSKHGLRRSSDEVRIAIERMVEDHPGWSNRRIARAVGISEKTVRNVVADCGLVRSPVREGTDGRTIDTRRIGSDTTGDETFDGEEDANPVRADHSSSIVQGRPRKVPVTLIDDRPPRQRVKMWIEQPDTDPKPMLVRIGSEFEHPERAMDALMNIVKYFGTLDDLIAECPDDVIGTLEEGWEERLRAFCVQGDD